MNELNKTVHLFLSKLGDLNNKKIVVGFSGGADSTVLLDILNQKKSFFNFNLEAVFFTHGSSPIAVDEDIMKNFCINFCSEREIPLNMVDLDLQKVARQGWESSGRQARQSHYKDVDTDFVFLGHHKDDQNETTLTQLLRGGGKGTIGMKTIDGIYHRPLLNHFKSEIYDYLNKNNLKWIEDPTNKNTEFTRNFWRNIGIPTIKEHYPDYSQKLDKFRKKQSELYELAYEMALEDGLNDFLEYKNVNLKKITKTRLKNLIQSIFNAYSKSMEDAFYEQQVQNYFAHKKLNINTKGIILKIENNTLSNLIDLENDVKPRQNTKFN
jgi:tRNA(Ile)-lysidine synthetase-like protein